MFGDKGMFVSERALEIYNSLCLTGPGDEVRGNPRYLEQVRFLVHRLGALGYSMWVDVRIEERHAGDGWDAELYYVYVLFDDGEPEP